MRFKSCFATVRGTFDALTAEAVLKQLKADTHLLVAAGVVDYTLRVVVLHLPMVCVTMDGGNLELRCLVAQGATDVEAHDFLSSLVGAAASAASAFAARNGRTRAGTASAVGHAYASSPGLFVYQTLIDGPIDATATAAEPVPSLELQGADSTGTVTTTGSRSRSSSSSRRITTGSLRKSADDAETGDASGQDDDVDDEAHQHQHPIGLTPLLKGLGFIGSRGTADVTRAAPPRKRPRRALVVVSIVDILTVWKLVT
jgi:hypothetical protein